MKETTAKPTNVKQTNQQIARALIEALWTGNTDVARDHPGYWETLHTFSVAREAFPDLKVDIKRQLGDREAVATHIEMSGTHLGPLFGAEATGQHMTWPVVYVDTFRDGKVIEHAAEGWLDILIRIGALPPPG